MKSAHRIFFCAPLLAAPLGLQAQAADTVFLLREAKANYYHAIFISEGGDSALHKRLTDFGMDEWDREHYQMTLDHLRKQGESMQPWPIGSLPRQWVALHAYRGRLYAYAPSDYMNHHAVFITDTAVIDFGGEGPVAAKIVRFRRGGERGAHFGLAGFGTRRSMLRVEIVNPARGIAIFTYRSGGEVYHVPMIEASKIGRVPLIVNHCKTSKTVEFVFDKPGYEALLEMAKE